jgi:Zn-finger protein
VKPCKCGSYEINLQKHDRDGTDVESCDVCYWRHRAESALVAAWVLDERMLTLRKCIASAKAEGWQHMAIGTLESLTGGSEQKP